MITLDNICKTFYTSEVQTKALDGVSLTIENHHGALRMRKSTMR